MIIGLIGLKQVGKTTAADHLVENQDFTKHNFKDALVAEIKQNFPDLLNEIYLQDSKEWNNGIPPTDKDHLFRTKPPLMRTLMQNYGTEVRRGDNPNYWIKQWRDKMPSGDVVVDDVRFQNEADMVTTNGGILIRLERSDVEAGDMHASEVEQANIATKYTIEAAKGDFDSLYNQLDGIIELENRLS